MNSDFYKSIVDNSVLNKKQYCATVIDTWGSSPASIGQKILIDQEGTTIGTIGGGAIEQIVIADIVAGKITKAQKKHYIFNDTNQDESGSGTGMICGGSAEIFIDPLFTIDELFIFGAGHCSLELVSVMQNLGFFITVLDERDEWLKKHTMADSLIKCDFNDVEKHIKVPENSYIVIMTFGHINDEKVLKQFLLKKYKYVGMMGSLNKVNTLRANLSTERPDFIINDLHAPIGISINSKTPREIAVSIAAELIGVKNSI